MTTREPTPMTARELTAMAAATAAVTVALGVTLAALAGQLRAPDPIEAAVQETTEMAPSETPAASMPTERVILVPIERAATATQPASPLEAAGEPVEAVSEPAAAWGEDEDDDDDDHGERRRHDGERRRHRDDDDDDDDDEHRIIAWDDLEEEGRDG